jgi:hypothetical protein
VVALVYCAGLRHELSNLDAAAAKAIEQGHFPTALASSHGHMLCRNAMAMRNSMNIRGYDKS